MRIFSGSGCLALIALAFVIAGIQAAAATPAGVILMFVLGTALVVWIVLYQNNKKDDMQKKLYQQADALDRLGAGEFDTDDSTFATQKDEVIVIRLDRVVLKEYKSTGSTYSGGYAGVSFRVAKGLRANVGGTQGRSVRNPEESTAIDVGTVTFTNQRIVFAGENVVRTWDLDKIVNIEAGDNGITLQISVSNLQKTSILEAANFPDITPGLAASIALGWKKEGKKGAMADAKELGQRLRAVLDADNKGTNSNG